VPFTPNLKASKLFPKPSRSIRRQRDEGTSAVASLNQSRGPATASLQSSVALLASDAVWQAWDRLETKQDKV